MYIKVIKGVICDVYYFFGDLGQAFSSGGHTKFIVHCIKSLVIEVVRILANCKQMRNSLKVSLVTKLEQSVIHYVDELSRQRNTRLVFMLMSQLDTLGNTANSSHNVCHKFDICILVVAIVLGS